MRFGWILSLCLSFTVFAPLARADDFTFQRILSWDGEYLGCMIWSPHLGNHPEFISVSEEPENRCEILPHEYRFGTYNPVPYYVRPNETDVLRLTQ
jgi:hypothetical protein